MNVTSFSIANNGSLIMRGKVDINCVSSQSDLNELLQILQPISNVQLVILDGLVFINCPVPVLIEEVSVVMVQNCVFCKCQFFKNFSYCTYVIDIPIAPTGHMVSWQLAGCQNSLYVIAWLPKMHSIVTYWRLLAMHLKFGSNFVSISTISATITMLLDTMYVFIYSVSVTYLHKLLHVGVHHICSFSN